jgi:hypothetical protein
MFSRFEINNPHTIPTRQHYPWHELEEYLPEGGMWGVLPPTEQSDAMDRAEELMVNPNVFRDAMLKALIEWPRSCGVAMTTPGLNRRAWLGHAGTYLATGSTEDLTRLAWHRLDPAEQWAANDAADQAITAWHKQNSAFQYSLFGGDDA